MALVSVIFANCGCARCRFRLTPARSQSNPQPHCRGRFEMRSNEPRQDASVCLVCLAIWHDATTRRYSCAPCAPQTGRLEAALRRTTAPGLLIRHASDVWCVEHRAAASGVGTSCLSLLLLIRVRNVSYWKPGSTPWEQDGAWPWLSHSSRGAGLRWSSTTCHKLAPIRNQQQQRCKLRIQVLRI